MHNTRKKYISPILLQPPPLYLCELNWRDKIFIWFWLARDINYCYALCIKIGKRRVYPEAFHLREIWICRDRSCRTWWSNGFICGTYTYSRLRQMIHEKTILHTCKPFVSNPICMNGSDIAICIYKVTNSRYVCIMKSRTQVTYSLCDYSANCHSTCNSPYVNNFINS